MLWNRKVHHRTHKCPPTIPILRHLDPVHTPTSHVLKICLHIILPSKPGSRKWPLSLLFPFPFPSRLASSITLFSPSLNKSFPCYYKWHPLCVFLNFLFSVFGHCKASWMGEMCLVLTVFSDIVCMAVIVNAVMSLWVS
jgi:hypothetical protein